MRYLMLVCQDTADSTTPPTQADRAGAPDVGQWWHAAHEAGTHVMGDRLRPAAEAMTVRIRSGELVVKRGPLTEAGGLLTGFDVLECESAEQAIEIASGHAMAHVGVIELREMWPLTGE
ncbi:hypothetical protein EH165_00460 [Nakamurella antarctica]|uniref:YCII-related domain-containing protein n=1 Tax=Nakamurella antarctica TaxID=1902245 RepID=A0A3G8ZQ76_9ACTN|nr:YciI family protein [Nakamurella antarctica]AZI59298.1 hypothetical protein EH165_00460 [Nakamurella antarctica]